MPDEHEVFTLERQEQLLEAVGGRGDGSPTRGRWPDAGPVLGGGACCSLLAARCGATHDAVAREGGAQVMRAARALAGALTAMLLVACGGTAAPATPGDSALDGSGGAPGQGQQGGTPGGPGAPVDVTRLPACELLSEQDLQALFASDAVETLVVEPATSCVWTEQGGAISGDSGMLVELDVTPLPEAGGDPVLVPDGCVEERYPEHGEGSRIVRCGPGFLLVVVQQHGYRMDFMVRVDSGAVDEARVGDALGAMLVRLEG